MKDKDKIKLLENEASEFAKEILLNEVAIQDAQRMIAEVRSEGWSEMSSFKDRIEELETIITKLNLQNSQYKVEVFTEIKKLKDNEQ